MRIVHVGNPSVVAPLRELGHEVVSVFERWPEVDLSGQPFDLHPVWQSLGAPADLLLVVDTLGRQTLPYGLEDLPALRVYYAIDVHLNLFWQIHYGALFDLVLVAQKDYVPLFRREGLEAQWLPWGADDKVFWNRGIARPYDLCFVGTVDAETRPKRSAAVDLLKRRFGLVTFGERVDQRLSWVEMAEVFSQSRIVFNESILGELNFRIFEAMACGAMLITEDIGNGLRDLFTPGEHLVLYDCHSLLAKVEHYLGDEEERRRIAAAGAVEVASKHSLKHRMARLISVVEGRTPRRDPSPRRGFHLGMALHLGVTRGLVKPHPGLGRAAEYLQAAVDDLAVAEAAVALARILAMIGKPEAALSSLARARELDPTNVLGWFLAAELQIRRGDRISARDLFRGGVMAAPCVSEPARERALEELEADLDSSRCLCSLARVMREAGLVLIAGLIPKLDAGLPWTAYDYYQRAILADPMNEEAANDLASLLEYLKMNDFAARFRRLAVALHPWDAEARRRLKTALTRGYLLEEAAQQERVIACLNGDEPDGTVSERVDAYRAASAGWQDGGDKTLAQALSQRGSAIESDDPEALKACAIAALNLHDYSAARGYLERVVQYADASRVEMDNLFKLLRELEDSESSGPDQEKG